MLICLIFVIIFYLYLRFISYCFYEVISMRILLAEDERSLSSALVTILKYNNFSIAACYDSLEVLSFFNVNNYD